MANDLDMSIGNPGAKEFYTASWFFYYGFELMSRQLLVGFQIKLF